MQLVLDELQISSLVTNKTLVELFPFLLIWRDAPASCCRKQVRRPDYAIIARLITQLPVDQQLKFKKVLNADSVVVYIPNGDNVDEIIF